MGGPSGPMLSGRIAPICDESIGPEGPPTKAGPGGAGRDRPARADRSERIDPCRPIRSDCRPIRWDQRPPICACSSCSDHTGPWPR
ncbi:DUF6053 domain-containing protein [Lysobacter yananisis]|uniref:DUF6053 domain-containing protein n=1 Tax=Lysobacter yananisis TaxID=1003114 RepID=UPI003CE548E5